jgi:NOL1/NOP2/fmu family ribosome biogenesis protein
MTEDIEDWMRGNGVRRIVDMRKGWAVYLNRSDTFGTGETIAQALTDAEARS